MAAAIMVAALVLTTISSSRIYARSAEVLQLKGGLLRNQDIVFSLDA
jgi:hypothetical protein